MIKRFFKSFIFMALVVTMICVLSVLLKPKRIPEISLDNFHDEHRGYQELKDDSVDVLYIGSSHSFCSISPEDIFHDFGITGYVQGSSCQKVWQSYYYLQEFLYTQKPKVVILDTFMALDGRIQSEPYNREAIDKMSFSPAKVRSAWTAYKMNPENEDFLSYLVPALRYHDRWESLVEQDYAYFFTESSIPAKGFLPRMWSVSAEFNYSDYENLPTEVGDIDETCASYLTKIKELCDQNGISFILIKYPTLLWNGTNYLTIKKWADNNGVTYLDFNADEGLRNEIGIDWSTESLDGGNHLNYTGAMKMSTWMGNYLKNNFAFTDKRGDSSYKVWEDDYAYYKKCVTNFNMKSITDFDQYINELNSNEYIIIATIDYIDMKVWPVSYEKLSSLGLPEKMLSAPLLTPNLSIINTKSKKVLANTVDPETATYKGKLVGKECYVCSNLINGAQGFDCVFDKVRVTRDSDGLQIIVLDPQTGSHVDTSVWLVDTVGNLNRMP